MSTDIRMLIKEDYLHVKDVLYYMYMLLTSLWLINVLITTFEIDRPESSQNFMDTAKTVDLTCLCMQINNTAVFFNHTHIKRIKKSIKTFQQ